MNKGELIYLATPYSHKDPKVMEKRFDDVNKVAAKLMSEGFYVFSPISHTHPIKLAGSLSGGVRSLPGGWDYWEGFDRTMIKNCKCLVVLKLEGWEQSTGVQAEIKIAKELGLSVEYIDP